MPMSIEFDLNKKIKSHSVVIDFVFDENSEPLVVETNFSFAAKVTNPCAGHGYNVLYFSVGKNSPQVCIVDTLINKSHL